MADLSLKPLTELFGTKREQLGHFVSRGGVRLLGALVMAGLLSLNQAWPLDPWFFVGVTLLSLMAGLMMRAHLASQFPVLEVRRKNERLVWLTCLLGVVGAQVANLSLSQDSAYRAAFILVAPLVAQSMLGAALLTPGIALVALSTSVLLLGIPGVIPMDVLVGGWLSGAVAAHVVNPLKQRSDLIRALSVQVVAMAGIAASMVLVTRETTVPVWETALWGSVAAIGATAIFWLGVAILEKLFGIVSDWSLLELCSPEQPLLRELVLHAPGTYAHSVGVGNLAEEAARAIGANPLLCRTMAYYHDIGKTVRPNYFVENQMSGNLHDELTPTLSAQIIAAHVDDGVKLARQHKLPQIIVDSIEQHHGTTLISYFYHRAVEQGVIHLDSVTEERFRYNGPKPQKREIAILHLADIVEAASRVMPSDESTEKFVARLIEGSRADGQLDESELTFHDLQVIARSFTRSLAGLRHERIAYPSQEAPETPDSLAL